MRAKKLFKAKIPDLKEYVGKQVWIDGKLVTIEKIVGNLTHVAFYEINGEHLMNMLRFHAQMCGDTSITEEQFKEFEKIEMEAVKMPAKKSVLDPIPPIEGKNGKEN
jgi:hypothetical protein